MDSPMYDVKKSTFLNDLKNFSRHCACCHAFQLSRTRGKGHYMAQKLRDNCLVFLMSWFFYLICQTVLHYYSIEC